MAAPAVHIDLSWSCRILSQIHLGPRLSLCKFDLPKKRLRITNPPQVNWPKLNTPPWAVEAYDDVLTKAHKDPVVGPFLGNGRTDTGYLEEGKKRRE